MKPYSILIHGTGACGEGNAQSADIALQKLLEQLRTSGHTLTSVSMVIDGSTVPIIGAMQPHPAADAPASPDAVSLSSILRQLQAIDAKCDTIIVGTKKEGAAPAPAPKPPKEAKPRGARGEKVLPETPKEAHLDKDGKPAVPGDKPEGALPGSTGAADGDNVVLPPTTPPPDGIEQETVETSETTAQTEGAEG